MLHSRIQRVSHLLRNEIAEILLNDVKDPRLSFVTVSHVEVSKDLRKATVFISILSDEADAIGATLEALESAKGYIKSLLSERVILKFMPDLKFRVDQGARHAARIEAILRELASRRLPQDDGDPGQ